MKTNTIPRITVKILTAKSLLDSHIRLANPRTPETQSSLMMRRGYSYSLGVYLTPDNWIWGCYSFCYQHDLEKGFLTVQKRLNGEALEEYVKPIGGATFVLPGVVDEKTLSGRVAAAGLIPTLPVRAGRFLFFSFFLYFPAMCYISVIQMTDSLLHLLKNYLLRHCEKISCIKNLFDVLITYAVVPGSVTFHLEIANGKVPYGQRKASDRTSSARKPASGSDFLTLSLSASHYYNLGRVRGARSRDSLSVLPASNGLQEAKPSIVRAHSRVDVDACDVNQQRKVLSMEDKKAVIKARREAKRVLRRIHAAISSVKKNRSHRLCK